MKIIGVPNRTQSTSKEGNNVEWVKPTYIMFITIRITFPGFNIAAIATTTTTRCTHFVFVISMSRLFKTIDAKNTRLIHACFIDWNWKLLSKWFLLFSRKYLPHSRQLYVGSPTLKICPHTDDTFPSSRSFSNTVWGLSPQINSSIASIIAHFAACSSKLQRPGNTIENKSK